MTALINPPLALYVHLPWCVRKCPYCDFNSHVHKGLLPQPAYIDALLQDLALEVPRVQGRAVETIFFGGGTPSLFSPESMAKLMAGIRARVEVATDAEVTMEVNPGAIERGSFVGYRQAGINRVSLGAQSFGEHQLRLLGRIHAPSDTVRSLAELAEAGIGNFNLDLMHGLPEQSVAEALIDIEQGLGFKPPHVSHYQLTLEPGTVFFTQPPTLPDEEVLEQMQQVTHARMAAAGFRQYEVSAWARPGFECRHNLNYWRFGDYLGIGAGAHGKVTDQREQMIWRTEKLKQPRAYLAQSSAQASLGVRVAVDAQVRPFEYLLNALRLADGFEATAFEERTGLPLEVVAAPLALAQRRALLESTAKGFRATALGQRFLNDLQALFLPAPSEAS